MACNPPYCLGTGGWCGCNCRCCPPDPCYTSWTYLYECGTLASEWYWYGPPNAGCNCVPLPFRAPTIPIEFPDEESFTFGLDDEDGFVFAQAGPPDIDQAGPPDNDEGKIDPACVIPCVSYSITLTTTGCCLYGSGFSFIAVGSGTVTLSPCPSTACGNFTCSINGGGSSVSVADCDSISVSITPPSANCCNCCFLGSYGTVKFSFIGSKLNTVTGLRKTLIDKQAIINRIRKKTTVRR